MLDPAGTVAVVFGAHDWTRAGLPSAPSFRRSAAHLHAYLLAPRPRGLGLEPDLLLDLFDDPAPAGAQLVRIRDTVKGLVQERRRTPHPIQDILIYYVGHGTCEDGRHLHLLVRDSREGIEAQSSIGAPDLAQVLRTAAPQQRRLVILDCCFSEAAAEAFGAMGTLDEAVATTALRDLEPRSAPERGTLLLCSSPRKRASIGMPNAERTLFTGALLGVLTGGTRRASSMLSFADLRDDIYDYMLREFKGEPPRPALHQPEQHAGDLTRLPAFPNAAVSPAGNTRDDAPPGRPQLDPRPDTLPNRPERAFVPSFSLAARRHRSIIALGLLALVVLGAWLALPSGHPPGSGSLRPLADNRQGGTPSQPAAGGVTLLGPSTSLTTDGSRSLIVTRPRP